MERGTNEHINKNYMQWYKSQERYTPVFREPREEWDQSCLSGDGTGVAEHRTLESDF